MILDFKRQFEDGLPTYFVEKIKASNYKELHPIRWTEIKPKIHAIRMGDRWKVGKKIHFAIGARTKNYHCFATGMCRGVQNIVIDTSISNEKTGIAYSLIIKIDNRYLERHEIEKLITNEGFESGIRFVEWFDKLGKPVEWFDKSGKPVDDSIKFKRFEGQLIHWTDYYYISTPNAKTFLKT